MVTRFVSKSPADTGIAGYNLARQLKAGAVLAFYGGLGAGKTCFIQGLARGLGVETTVNSPTFTLINEYRGDLTLYHIDLYRITSADEALALGLDECIYGTGITAIEWAEHIEDLLPKGTIRIRLEEGTERNERIIDFQCSSEECSCSKK